MSNDLCVRNCPEYAAAERNMARRLAIQISDANPVGIPEKTSYERFLEMCIASDSCSGPREVTATETLPLSRIRAFLGMKTTRELIAYECCSSAGTSESELNQSAA